MTKEELITKIKKVHTLSINNPNINEGIAAKQLYWKLLKENNLTESDLYIQKIKLKQKTKLEVAIENFKNEYMNPYERITDKIIYEFPSWILGGKKIITFEKDFIEYESIKINYKDITHIQYNAVNKSINLIPTSQEKSFRIISDYDEIDVDLSSSFYINENKKENIWFKLINISQNFIEPLVIKKQLTRIFYENMYLNIDGLIIDKDGYSKKKFWGGTENVSWNDKIYIPKFQNGKVYIFKDKKETNEIFKEISLGYPNSIILPELFDACEKLYIIQKLYENLNLS